jgi:hypothetical protein
MSALSATSADPGFAVEGGVLAEIDASLADTTKPTDDSSSLR